MSEKAQDIEKKISTIQDVVSGGVNVSKRVRSGGAIGIEKKDFTIEKDGTDIKVKGFLTLTPNGATHYSCNSCGRLISGRRMHRPTF